MVAVLACAGCRGGHYLGWRPVPTKTQRQLCACQLLLACLGCEVAMHVENLTPARAISGTIDNFTSRRPSQPPKTTKGEGGGGVGALDPGSSVPDSVAGNN